MAETKDACEKGITAQRAIEAASGMRERANRLDRFAFRKLFGDAKLAEDMDAVTFVSVLRVAEQCEACGNRARAGEGFVLLAGNITDKARVAELSLRGARNYLGAGMLEEACRAFDAAILNTPVGEDAEVKREAILSFIAFGEKAEADEKAGEAACAFAYAALKQMGESGMKEAAALYYRSSRLHVAAGNFYGAKDACLLANGCERLCNPEGDRVIINGIIQLLMEKVEEFEGMGDHRNAALVYSLAAELKGKISPEMSHPLYMAAMRHYAEAGDSFRVEGMLSKAADSIAEMEPATAARLKEEAGEINLECKYEHGAAVEFAAAAKLLEVVNPASSLNLHIRSGDLYAVARVPDNDDDFPDRRFFGEAREEYDAAIELAKRVDAGRLVELEAKMSILIDAAKAAGQPLK